MRLPALLRLAFNKKGRLEKPAHHLRFKKKAAFRLSVDCENHLVDHMNHAVGRLNLGFGDVAALNH